MSQTEAERFESLTDWARMKASVITYPIARVLHRWGFHPNTITLLGLGLTVGVSVVVGVGTKVGVAIASTGYSCAMAFCQFNPPVTTNWLTRAAA